MIAAFLLVEPHGLTGAADLLSSMMKKDDGERSGDGESGGDGKSDGDGESNGNGKR